MIKRKEENKEEKNNKNNLYCIFIIIDLLVAKVHNEFDLLIEVL